MNRFFWLSAIALMLAACGDDDNSAAPSAESSSSVKSSSSAKSSSSSVVTFGSMTDSRDGQTYKTVVIDYRVWMAENLKYESQNYSCYDDDESLCSKYGRLYVWKGAKTDCPEGWHLPDKDEFRWMIGDAGGKTMAGEMLKSKDGWEDGGNGRDAYGFSVLPAGYREARGASRLLGRTACFWTSTQYDDNYAYYIGFDKSDSVSLSIREIKMACSVRCVKD